MIANLLSASRIVLAILFIVLTKHRYVVLSIIVIAGLTDILDGFFARKYGKTKFGKILDSVADKFFVLMVVIGLVLNYGLIILYGFLMLSRDIMNGVVLPILYLLKKKKHVPEVNIFGKITTLVLVVTFISIILGFYNTLLIPIAIFVSIFTALYYLIFNFP